MKKQMHIGIGEQGVKYCLLPGDPGRTEEIASYLDSAEELSFNREYRIFKGQLEGAGVLVCSTGIGGPSAAIAIEELYIAGVREFIRIGTTGGIAEQVGPGDLVLPSAAVRAEGTSHEYLPAGYPAAADFDLLSALHEAAEKLAFKSHVGVVQSKDSFYGQHSPGRMPVAAMLEEKWEAYIKAGCLASEMECAAIFSVAQCLKDARAAAVLTTLWNQEREKKGLKEEAFFDNSRAISTAVEALRIRIGASGSK